MARIYKETFDGYAANAVMINGYLFSQQDKTLAFNRDKEENQFTLSIKIGEKWYPITLEGFRKDKGRFFTLHEQPETMNIQRRFLLWLIKARWVTHDLETFFYLPFSNVRVERLYGAKNGEFGRIACHLTSPNIVGSVNDLPIEDLKVLHNILRWKLY